MSDPCDICGQLVLDGEACHGGADPGPRHWDCHVARHGVPDPFGLRRLRELKEEAERLQDRLGDIQRRLR